MATRKYDFDAGVSTASSPTVAAPTAIGDIVALGAKTTFTLVNNQSSAANVTGLLFDKTVYRSFMLTYSIYRSASGGSTRAETGILMGITDGTNWEIATTAVTVPATGDSGVTFSITSSGQIQYTSDDNGGSYSAANSVMSYELLQLMGV
jgi:hypothetical protein